MIGLSRLSSQELALLNRIRVSPDFNPLIQLFKKELALADGDNRILEGVHLARSQGKAQFLQAILEEIEESAKNLGSRNKS